MEQGSERLPATDLKGKIAMVTGAAGGIGSVIARSCALAGADVILCDYAADSLAQIEEDIVAQGRRAIRMPFNLLDVQAIRRAVDDVCQRMGHIDILVNCAGANTYRLALDVSEQEWDRTIGINLKGLFFTSQAVARTMVESKRKGKIINIASVMGLRGGDYRSVYCASKGGVVQLTKAMSIELAPHGINVNAIAPTFTATAINREMLEDPARKAQILSSIPLGRLGAPMDTAAAVIFLASEASDFITGHILAVDGGRLAT